MNLYEINDFKGLNESSSGELTLKKGESLSMDNFRIEDGRLVTRNGYRALFSLGEFEVLQGVTYGKITYSEPLLYFAADDKLYSFDVNNGEKNLIGELDNLYSSSRFALFFWSDTLYVLTGTQYYKYNENGLQTVSGTVPTLKTGAAPSGTGGTVVSERNLLTNKAVTEFIGDGVTADYKLINGSVSVSKITVNGLQTTAFTVNASLGTVVFSSPPSLGAQVVVEFSMPSFSKRQLVCGCTSSMVFGGVQDFSLFSWGNSERPYMRINSFPGDPEFFPESGQYRIGSRQHEITDIIPFYDRQIIFTKKGLYYSTVNESASKTSFPVFPLNSGIGNIVPNSVCLADNKPIFIDNGIYELTSTSVRDERNVKELGKRVSNALPLENAVTHEDRSRGEYYLSIGNITYVYHFKQELWYRFSGFAVKQYLNINGDTYFIRSDNVLCLFDKTLCFDLPTLGSNDRVPISAYWEMPIYDAGSAVSYKFTDRIFLSLLPRNKTRVSLTIENEKRERCGEGVAENLQFDFSDLTFCIFSFQPVLRKKPFVLRMKSRGYAYLKLRLSVSSDETPCTILSVCVPANIAGKIR